MITLSQYPFITVFNSFRILSFKLVLSTRIRKQNLRNQCYTDFSQVLDEEQMETLNMLVPATSRFFEENVDALKFDAQEKVDDDVVQGMKELGAFGLQVSLCEFLL